MISSYILMALAGLGILINLIYESMIGVVSSIVLLIFAFMFYEHFSRLQEIVKQQEKIELNQRSLILLLNDKKENKEDINNGQ